LPTGSLGVGAKLGGRDDAFAVDVALTAHFPFGAVASLGFDFAAW
jgi:hypothetical protein